MLDKKTTSVLKVLYKLSEGNAYKVITSDEILSSITPKSQYDLETIKQCIEFLEKQQYLNIKFSEENTYCYSLLPKARIFLEQDNKSAPQKNKQEIKHYLFIMISAFIGTMLALLIFFYLTF